MNETTAKELAVMLQVANTLSAFHNGESAWEDGACGITVTFNTEEA